MGIDTEEDIFSFFGRHNAEWFPKLPRLHRTNFTRQAANLWKVKRLSWKALLEKFDYDGAICLVDPFTFPVCTLAKALRHRSFASTATRGYDAMARAVFYSLEVHLRVAWPR